MSDMSMIGYMKTVAPSDGGFKASAQDCFPFWDVLSAATSFAAANKRAERCGGKVVHYMGDLCGQSLRQQYASIEPVGKGIGEWEPEMTEVVS